MNYYQSIIFICFALFLFNIFSMFYNFFSYSFHSILFHFISRLCFCLSQAQTNNIYIIFFFKITIFGITNHLHLAIKINIAGNSFVIYLLSWLLYWSQLVSAIWSTLIQNDVVFKLGLRIVTVFPCFTCLYVARLFYISYPKKL